jgi:hypothetical protein
MFDYFPGEKFLEHFLFEFNKDNDSIDMVLNPIINDLKIAQGLLIKFITSSKDEQFYNIEKIMARINKAKARSRS